MAATHTAPAPKESTNAPVPARATNSVPAKSFAPPRLSLQNSNKVKVKDTPPFEERSALKHYNGTPRQAGTVAQNSRRSASSGAPGKNTVAAAESSEGQMASNQAGQIPSQAAGSVSVAYGQEPSQANDDATANGIILLRVFGVLVLLALGTWSLVRFLGYWKGLEPFSSAVGGIYSDDSEEGRAEGSSSKVIHRNGFAHETEKPTAQKTNGSQPKAEFFEREAKYGERAGNETNGFKIEDLTQTAPIQRFFESDEKYSNRIAQKENGAAPTPRFVESDDEADKSRSI